MLCVGVTVAVAVAVVCGVWHAEKPPCERSKRPRVYRHHAHMLKHMCAWCRYTRGRFECTHGKRFERTHQDVVDAYTPSLSHPTQQHSTKHNTTQHRTRHTGAREAREEDAYFLSRLVNTLFLFSTTMTMITGSLVVCGMWVKCLCVACCCCLMFCVMCVVDGLCMLLWLYMRVMVWFLLSVTRACFEFVTTLTFRALHGNHTVSTPFQTIVEEEKHKKDK